MMKAIIRIIIPAYNEQRGVGKVVGAIPASLVEEVIVVNNGSTDETASAARRAGAVVIDEPRRGYGWACLKGLEYLANSDTNTDIVVFMDGDYADHPEEMSNLIGPIVEDKADLVIGSRTLGRKEKGAITPQQVFGNWLATKLLYFFYGARFTDLGPFRAIRYNRLVALNMQDKTYGWTVEMQLKAAKHDLRSMEVPVNYKKRIGKSKVSGTIKGTFMAGYKIIWTILKYR